MGHSIKIETRTILMQRIDCREKTKSVIRGFVSCGEISFPVWMPTAAAARRSRWIIRVWRQTRMLCHASTTVSMSSPTLCTVQSLTLVRMHSSSRRISLQNWRVVWVDRKCFIIWRSDQSRNHLVNNRPVVLSVYYKFPSGVLLQLTHRTLLYKSDVPEQ